jgi:hypothetical protein
MLKNMLQKSLAVSGLKVELAAHDSTARNFKSTNLSGFLEMKRAVLKRHDNWQLEKR